MNKLTKLLVLSSIASATLFANDNLVSDFDVVMSNKSVATTFPSLNKVSFTFIFLSWITASKSKI